MDDGDDEGDTNDAHHPSAAGGNNGQPVLLTLLPCPVYCRAQHACISALVLNSFSVARRVPPKATIGGLNSVTYLIENAVLCPIMLQTQLNGQKKSVDWVC